MTIKCCDFLIHEIAFYKDSIRPCCSFSIEGDKTPFVNDYNGDIEKFKLYLEKRAFFIKQFQDGEIPFCYPRCTTYEPKKDDKTSFQLKNIIISNYTKCSCNCIYCEQAAYGRDKNYKKWLNTRTCYDIKPILIYLRENNYIEENCRFIICGGECSEYPKGEVDWLIYFANQCKGNLLILSSGIKYSTAIEQALINGNTILKISTDSGTQKTYEKIKRVKAFDNVWENIKKYSQNISFDNGSRIELKYIIIPNINDNVEEIIAFLDMAKNCNVKHIVVDVEHEWIKLNKNNCDREKLSCLLNCFFEHKSEGMHIEMEGVEGNWLWSFVKDEYNYKKVVQNEL